MVRRNMQIDFGWEKTAESYIDLYSKVCREIDLERVK